MHISPDTLQELSTAQSDLVSFVRLKTGRFKLLNKKQAAELEKKIRQLEKDNDGAFCRDIQELVQLLDFLTTVFLLFTAEDEGNQELVPDYTRISPILNYIQDHISEPLSLDELSSQFFINKFHMCHLFKAATGFSVMEYIIHCRILKARKLLRHGARVQEAGESVGFQNNAHFIRTFRKLTGTSPKRYAKEYLSRIR
jgi:YesN/AraC family two-component response regulator